MVLSERPISVPKYTVPSDPQKLFLYTNASLVLLIQLGFVAFNNVSCSLSIMDFQWLALLARLKVTWTGNQVFPFILNLYRKL